jgi:virulence factor Mce-like protein
MRRAKGRNRSEVARDRGYRRAAAISAVLITLVTLAAFTKSNPFSRGYQLRADFSNVAELSVGGDVRIAGISVGQVSGISAGPRNTSIVTMSISSRGLPIHSDATLTIKPRLILEGNAYVDVDPGTPEAPDLHSGATLPISQTSVPVQIDQLLDVFDQPVRQALQSTVANLSTGLGGHAPAGYAALRASVRELDHALGGITSVAHAVRGTQAGDLGSALQGSDEFTSDLAEHPAALADLVGSYNRVVGALASQDHALSASVVQIDDLFRSAPGALAAIDAALPKLTHFASGLRPALRAAPGSFTNASGLLDEIAKLVRPSALPSLLSSLAPVLGDLPTLQQRLGTLFSYTTPVTNCITSHIVPVLDSKLSDGPNSTGDPVYLDMLHLFTGLTSLASAVDGNGGTLRLGVTTGDHIVDTLFPGIGQVVGRLPNVDGVRPTWLGYGVDPPFRPDQPCASQLLPNLEAGSGPAPSWAR